MSLWELSLARERERERERERDSHCARKVPDASGERAVAAGTREGKMELRLGSLFRVHQTRLDEREREREREGERKPFKSLGSEDVWRKQASRNETNRTQASPLRASRLRPSKNPPCSRQFGVSISLSTGSLCDLFVDVFLLLLTRSPTRKKESSVGFHGKTAGVHREKFD